MNVPDRLSKQQQFILGWLTQYENDTWELRVMFERSGNDVGTGTPTAELSELSWAVAREFDSDETPRIERLFDEAEEHAGEQGLDFDSEEVTAYMMIQMVDREKKDRLAATHRSSVSRTLDRLENRELILKHPQYRVALTAGGRKAGEKVLQHHRDGRYSLSFDTLE